jgi:hypothetical protein
VSDRYAPGAAVGSAPETRHSARSGSRPHERRVSVSDLAGRFDPFRTFGKVGLRGAVLCLNVNRAI